MVFGGGGFKNDQGRPRGSKHPNASAQRCLSEESALWALLSHERGFSAVVLEGHMGMTKKPEGLVWRRSLLVPLATYAMIRA